MFLLAKSFSICGFTLDIASRDRELEGILPPAIVVDDTAQIASKADKMIIFFIVFFLKIKEIKGTSLSIILDDIQ